MEQFLLSFLIFLPLLAAGLVICLPSRWIVAFRWITLLTTILQVGIALRLYTLFDSSSARFQFTEEFDWITMPLGGFGQLSIDYLVGTDGFSLPMILLSALVLCIGALSSWTIDQKHKAYFALYLLL